MNLAESIILLRLL